MDEVWRGQLTCDYEHTRPEGTPLEHDLYTTSLVAWPRALLQEDAPYGHLRRPGIVDIPEADHHRLVGLLHDHLTDPRRAHAVVARVLRHRQDCDTSVSRLEAALNAAAPTAAPAIARATADTLAVMSTHIVNWLLPEQQWEDLMTRLLGRRDAARECIFALTTPPATGHLLGAHSQLLHTVQDVQAGTALAVAAASITARAGTLYGPGSPAARPMPLEDPDQAADLLQARLLTSAPAEQLDQIDAARTRAGTLSAAWELAAALAAAGDPDATGQVQALITVGRWASDSEERRKVLRHRYLAAARRWCRLTGNDPLAITTRELLAEEGAR